MWEQWHKREEDSVIVCHENLVLVMCDDELMYLSRHVFI
jgi:hypothetical protein